MRHALPLLLFGLLAAAGDKKGTVGDGKTFEMPLPNDVDWEVGTPDRGAKVLLLTEFADSDPKATGEVRVTVHEISSEFAKKGLDEIARDWAPTIEDIEPFKTKSKVEEGKAKLGGEEAWFRDVRADWARLTWHIARKNGFLFVFHVLRTNVAVDDADLEAQIEGMRAAFTYLEQPKVTPEKPDKARPPEPPPIDPEKVKRTEKTLGHWRLQLVKPEGLLEVAPGEFTPAEKANDIVAKFEGKGSQTLIMVRIYARTAATRKLTLDQLAEQKVKRFEDAYDMTSRLPAERDQAWKPPLVDRAIRLVLTGRKGTIQTTRWFLAECKNDRQYQVEVYVSGGEKDAWAKEIQELLDGFRPLRE